MKIDVCKNILFICSTNYADGFAKKFESKYFLVVEFDKKKYPNIHEVVLLDLCTKNKRDAFFGDTSGAIEKVVQKPEVENIE
jgi:hypothetical protein